MSNVVNIHEARLKRMGNGDFPESFPHFDSFLDYLEHAGTGYIPYEHLLMAYEMNTGVSFSEQDLGEIVPPGVSLLAYFHFNLPETVRELKEKFQKRKSSYF